MEFKLFQILVCIIITTKSYCQLQYPVMSRYFLPVGYVNKDPEPYNRRRYVALYDPPQYVQRWEEPSIDDYIYDDYYSEEIPNDLYNEEKEGASDLLMKYMMNAHKRRYNPVRVNRRIEMPPSTMESPPSSTASPKSEGQKEIVMLRSPADGRRVKPAWLPSLEDQLSRIKSKKQKPEEEKPERRTNGEDLTDQLDKLEKSKN